MRIRLQVEQMAWNKSPPAPEGERMEHLQYASQVVKENLPGWLLFGFVFSMSLSFTGGLLMILLPNAIRATRRAIATNAAPDLGDLFQFDTIVDDVVAVLALAIAYLGGSALCGIGVFFTVPILFFTAHVVSENTYDGVGSIKVAIEHGKSNLPGTLFEMLVIGMVLFVFIVVTFGFGTLLAVPVALVSLEHFYQQQRPHILAAAHAAQIPARG